MSAINNPGGGVTKQGKITLFDRVCHAETPVPSPRLLAPSKFFLVTSAADEVAAPERALEAVTRSPTSIRQAGSPTTSSYPSACPSLSGGTVVPISHGGGRGNSRRPWDARLGLAGALNGEPTAAAAATTLLTGRHSLRVRPSCSPSLAASSRDVDVSSCWWNTNEPVRQRFDRWSLAPGEMEASEDYCTRVVIARELDPRTEHVLDGHVGGIPVRGGHGEFLRWCHGCSKELGQGKDIFMYRGKMAFCSHECRCLEMLLDEKSSDADCLRVFKS